MENQALFFKMTAGKPNEPSGFKGCKPPVFSRRPTLAEGHVSTSGSLTHFGHLVITLPKPRPPAARSVGTLQQSAPRLPPIRHTRPSGEWQLYNAMTGCASAARQSIRPPLSSSEFIPVWLDGCIFFFVFLAVS